MRSNARGTMAVSTFALRQKNDTRRLFKQLTNRLLDEPQPEVSAIAVQHCLYKAKHRGMLAVNPIDVNLQYQSLLKHLRINSQTTRAARLEVVTKRLLEQQGATNYLDNGHRVLLLLLSLADNPGAELDSGISVDDLAQSTTEPIQGEASDDLTDKDDEASSRWSTESEEWSSDSEAAEVDDQAAEDSPAGNVPVSTNVAHFYPSLDFPSPMPVLHQEDNLSNGEESLLEQLLSIRRRHVPMTCLASTDKTTEQALVRGVMHLMQGHPGGAFSWDSAGKAFRLSESTHIPHLSISALRRMLDPLIDSASALRRVELLVQGIAGAAHGVVPPGGLSEPPLAAPCGPTVQAFAHAAGLRLQALRGRVLALEESCQGGSDTWPSLLRLSLQLSGICKAANFLEAAVTRAMPPQASTSPAEASALLLDELHRLLSSACLNKDGKDEAGRTLLALLAGALQPLLRALGTWLQSGNISDPSGEFLINASAALASSPDIAPVWHEGYTLRTRQLPDNWHPATPHSASAPAQTPSQGFGSGLASKRGPLSSLASWSRFFPQGRSFPPPSSQLSSQRVTAGTQVASGRDKSQSESVICPEFLRPLVKGILAAGKAQLLLAQGQRGGATWASCADLNIHPARHVQSVWETLRPSAEESPCQSSATDVDKERGEEARPSLQAMFERVLIQMVRELPGITDTWPGLAAPADQGILGASWVPPGETPLVLEGLADRDPELRLKGMQFERVLSTGTPNPAATEISGDQAKDACPAAEGRRIRGQDGGMTRPDEGGQVEGSSLGGSECAERLCGSFDSAKWREAAERKCSTCSRPSDTRTGWCLLGADVAEALESGAAAPRLVASTAGGKAAVPLCLPSPGKGGATGVDLELSSSPCCPQGSLHGSEAGSSSQRSVADVEKCECSELPCSPSIRETLGMSAEANVVPQERQVDASPVMLSGEMSLPSLEEEGFAFVISEGSSSRACTSLLPDPQWLCSCEDVTPGNTDDGQEADAQLLETLRGTKEGLLCGTNRSQQRKSRGWGLEGRGLWPSVPGSFSKGHLALSGSMPLVKQDGECCLQQVLETAEIAGTPFPDDLFERCILRPVGCQVVSLSEALLARLHGEWGLMAELGALREFYLMASGHLTLPFLQGLYGRLERRQPWLDLPLLSSSLQESVELGLSHSSRRLLRTIQVALREDLPGAPRSGTVTGGKGRGAGPPECYDIEALSCLSFTCQVAWPLELIIDAEAMSKYNEVFRFLVKAKRARHSLEAAASWRAQRTLGRCQLSKDVLLLRLELARFVTTICDHLLHRVVVDAWAYFQVAMQGARSLDDVAAAHRAYLAFICKESLLSNDPMVKLVSSRVHSVFSFALDFCSLQRHIQLAEPNSANWQAGMAGLLHIGQKFHDCIAFLLQVLPAKLNTGENLVQLLLLLDYNNYYMSKDGLLKVSTSRS